MAGICRIVRILNDAKISKFSLETKTTLNNDCHPERNSPWADVAEGSPGVNFRLTKGVLCQYIAGIVEMVRMRLPTPKLLDSCCLFTTRLRAGRFTHDKRW